MSKIRTGLTALLCVAALTASLAGCTQQLNTSEIQTAYKEAVKNSIESDLYYWKETKNDGKTVDYRQTNVYAPQDKHYEPIRNAQGDYEQIMVEVIEKKAQKDSLHLYCGRSGEKDFLFTTTYQDGKEDQKTIAPMTGKDFVNSKAFEPYRLSTLLQELQELTVDDMNFDVKGSEKTQKVKINSLVFQVKDEYLQRYRQKYGKDSIFAGSKRVSIEISYGKIAHVIAYADEQVEKGISSEIEKYKLEVVYLGPVFGIPDYQQQGADGQPVWKEA